MQTITKDEFSGMISLFDNGTVKDSSESPYCDNKQKISLSSYDFRIKTKCRDGNTKCKFATMPLSTEAALLLHGGCSFKDECGNLDFAKVAKNHNNASLHILLIDYYCLGDMDRLFEMCEDRVETVTGAMHLVSGKTTRQYSNCKCSLKSENNSVVAVKIKDIRLYSTGISPRECSKSVLKVDENTFACNPTTSTFGSIFNKALPKSAHNESISVSLEIKGHDHEMVWLTVETQGSMSVECSGRLTETVTVASTSNKKYGQVPPSDIQSDNSSMDDTKDPKELTLIAVPVIATGVLCVAIGSAICLCHTIQRKKFVKSNLKSIGVPPSDLNHDKTPKATYPTRDDCYMKEVTDFPVQESEQYGRDTPAEENHHTYAPLNHSSSKNSGTGTNENEIYHKAQFNKLLPQRDPTYNYLLADRRFGDKLLPT